MSSILIEFVLKHTAFIIKEAGSYEKANPQDWDQFENMELSPAISRARAPGWMPRWQSGSILSGKKAKVSGVELFRKWGRLYF